MARAILNGGLISISGGIDKWVYRNYRGKTIISRRSISTTEPSAAQRQRRNRFSDAVAYAKSVLASPEHRMSYEARAVEQGRSVFSLALAEYLKRPATEWVAATTAQGTAESQRNP